MKKVLIVICSIVLISYGCNNNTEKKETNTGVYASKKFSTEDAFKTDLDAFAKEVGINKEEAECIGFYYGYQKKASKDFTTMTYGQMRDSAKAFCLSKKDESSKVKTTDGWSVVDSLKGNGKKQGGTFHLNGYDTKIVYAYKSNMEESGIFTVYIEPKGYDIATQGAIPTIMISSPKESSESFITKKEGDYYLSVDASGDYVIYILEKK